MNESLSQFMSFLKDMPLSRKVSMAVVLSLVIAGFALMFLWANQPEYRVLFDELSPEDAASVVSLLKERHIPHQIEGNARTILVPGEQVFDLRLSLASEGLPKGGHVGYELFDHTDFRTTRFVQNLNYKRALQGELARTIDRFDEVKRSMVFIVLPKETLFVEEEEPASASIQLELKAHLSPDKVAAIVHLVASAVEGLDAQQVTVVDTRGRVLFKGESGENASSLLNPVQLDYKSKVEQDIRKNVQTMLESILGSGNAIVRVNAEIDFSRVTSEQEEYDPASAAIRSHRNIEEFSESKQNGMKDPKVLQTQTRAGVLPASSGAKKNETRKDVATNYELSRITRATIKPPGSVTRLSVAAVIDGAYKVEQGEDGAAKGTFVPRNEDELKKFEEIIKGAMGYNEDREDKVSVACIPFSGHASNQQWTGEGPRAPGLFDRVLSQRKILLNLLLMVLVFIFGIRPLMKYMKSMTRETVGGQKELEAPAAQDHAQIPEQGEPSMRERILEITQRNPEKAEQLIKQWINE